MRAEEVQALRSARDAARMQFDDRVAQLRGDLEERGVAGRLADEMAANARATLDDALDVAGENKGVIAGTLVLLVLWFLRHPILAKLEGLLGAETDIEGNDYDR